MKKVRREEIKKLKFVESVKLGDDGILVKFATIHIKVKDEDILMGTTQLL